MRKKTLWIAVLTLGCWVPILRADYPIEEQPKDPKQTKIVLIAGTNFYKAGEHEYVGGCKVLYDLLKQTPNVFPVLALDWPKNPETLKGAKSIVFFFDGGDKHGLLKEDRFQLISKLAEEGVGLVAFHQCIDFPKDFGDRVRTLMGAAFEKGYSQRAHWVSKFDQFPKHPISNGVIPFEIDDGWLYKLRYVPGLKGVTPLCRTVSPKKPTEKLESEGAIVGWAYEREKQGRSFTFTGCHLHSSLGQEGYRRFLVNGILWSAQLEIPSGGAPVALNEKDLPKYIVREKK